MFQFEFHFQNQLQTILILLLFYLSPAPPVTVLKFENRWDPINTKAKVTSPRFNPFNLTVIGAIIKPTIEAAIPDKGSQIIISNSYPITL